MMLFTFSGSSHTKYMAYILEMVCDLELESGEELRLSILSNLLVNLSGRPGHFAAGDLMQEYFNRLLQAIVERKGTQYNTPFVRNIVSRNLHHMARLQDDIKASLGLESRPGTHPDPHQRPEIRILLEEYKATELHLRRPGRVIGKKGADPRDTDDFRRGVLGLRSGKLSKWIKESIFLRSPRRSMYSTSNPAPQPMPTTISGEHSLSDDDADDPEATEDPADLSDMGHAEPADAGESPMDAISANSLVSLQVLDGQLVVTAFNAGDVVEAILTEVSQEASLAGGTGGDSDGGGGEQRDDTDSSEEGSDGDNSMSMDEDYE